MRVRITPTMLATHIRMVHAQEIPGHDWGFPVAGTTQAGAHLPSALEDFVPRALSGLM